MNILEFQERKHKKQKISMITCYDYTFAKILNETNIDCLLVGDSLAMVMHGYPTTLNASVEMMALHTMAVAKGAPKKLIVGDLPFMSYRKSLTENMNCVEQIMKAGAHAVKLEGARGNLELIRHCVDSGVPVMGHLGLTPQSVHQLGGFKVQGRDEKAQNLIKQQALQLQEAGCFSVVLECVPSVLAQEISRELEIPTIGIGAGADCDGQVLVLQDMLGMNEGFTPKFLRKYFNGFEELKNIFNKYHSDVIHKEFPTEKESYS
ncbi:3-methyl-2-oxobutanoate hydroxymethyltransferase [Bdellovibrio sp. HCB337]|uniref:3-methyl-2-oxobutanoate hydroxymethyltransferase n=1 Tax=Bdellovibrio sp. HCB337 TaxID=3394358 RepID=UPI0039A52C8C